MAKPSLPKTALMGNSNSGPGGGGTPITRTVVRGSDNKTPKTKSPSTNRTPLGRSVAGNW